MTRAGAVDSTRSRSVLNGVASSRGAREIVRDVWRQAKNSWLRSASCVTTALRESLALRQRDRSGPTRSAAACSYMR